MFFENANTISIDGQEVQSIRIGDEEVYKKNKNIYENPLITSMLNVDIPITTNHFVIEFDMYYFPGSSSRATANLLTDEFGSNKVLIGFTGEYISNGIKASSNRLLIAEDYPKSTSNYHIKFEYNDGEITYYNGIKSYNLDYSFSNIRFAGCTIIDCKISNLVIYEVKD